MILRLLGLLDAIAGVLALTPLHAYAAYYLVLKGLIFLPLSPKCVLTWCDLLLGVVLVFFYSSVLGLLAFLYLIFKAFLSFM